MYKIISENVNDSVIGAKVIEFDTYIEFINYLSKFNYKCRGNENGIFDRTKVCNTDTYYKFWWSGDKEVTGYYSRYIILLNQDGNNVYDSKLKYDVSNWKYSDSIENNRLKKIKNKRFTHRGKYLASMNYFEFRKGPCPYIHKRTYGNYFRHPKTMNEIRQTMAYPEFNRGSRGKNLPTLWDDNCRDYGNKNWKRQGKRKHQWEKKAIRAEKNVYVYKIADVSFIGEEIDMDIYDMTEDIYEMI